MKTQNLSIGELPKKYKVTLHDNSNTVIFTNSLTKLVRGKEVNKFDKSATIETLTLKNKVMTYKFNFLGDYGYELSSLDINAINGMQSIEEKAQYCDGILERESGYKKIVKQFGVDVILFCSQNGHIMFSVYCIND